PASPHRARSTLTIPLGPGVVARAAVVRVRRQDAAAGPHAPRQRPAVPRSVDRSGSGRPALSAQDIRPGSTIPRTRRHRSTAPRWPTTATGAIDALSVATLPTSE